MKTVVNIDTAECGGWSAITGDKHVFDVEICVCDLESAPFVLIDAHAFGNQGGSHGRDRDPFIVLDRGLIAEVKLTVDGLNRLHSGIGDMNLAEVKHCLTTGDCLGSSVQTVNRDSLQGEGRALSGGEDRQLIVLRAKDGVASDDSDSARDIGNF